MIKRSLQFFIFLFFNESCNNEEANDKLATLVEAFADSNIEEYTKFYNLLINWFKKNVNSFSAISGRKINNSYIESRNNQLDKLFFNANGFINFKRTRNRILYCVNKYDTYKI